MKEAVLAADQEADTAVAVVIKAAAVMAVAATEAVGVMEADAVIDIT